MKKNLFTLILLLVSTMTFAQYVSYDDFMRIFKSTRHSEASQFLVSKGWKFYESWKDGTITGNPWEVIVYTKNCTVKDSEPRNTGTGWSIIEVSKLIKNGKTEWLNYKFDNNNVYTQFLSRAKADGFKYDEEYSGDGEFSVSYRRNKACMLFIQKRNYYSIEYMPTYYDY